MRVLYLGDYDLSGDLIETNTRRVLERATGYELRWERLALTKQQIEEYEPTIVKRDQRYKDGHPHEAVATEAIRARARELWEASGCPPGRDLEFWLKAEEELRETEIH